MVPTSQNRFLQIPHCPHVHYQTHQSDRIDIDHEFGSTQRLGRGQELLLKIGNKGIAQNRHEQQDKTVNGIVIVVIIVVSTSVGIPGSTGTEQ